MRMLISPLCIQLHLLGIDDTLCEQGPVAGKDFYFPIIGRIIYHERSKDVLVIVCFCSPFDVFMGFCFSRPAWPFCTQAQMS